MTMSNLTSYYKWLMTESITMNINNFNNFNHKEFFSCEHMEL